MEVLNSGALKVTGGVGVNGNLHFINTTIRENRLLQIVRHITGHDYNMVNTELAFNLTVLLSSPKSSGFKTRLGLSHRKWKKLIQWRGISEAYPFDKSN